MIKKLQLFLLLLCSFIGLGSYAQTFPIRITTQLTQPSPIYLSNYADANTTNSPIKIQLVLNDLTISNRQVRLKIYFQGNGIAFNTNDFVVGAKPLYLEGGFPLQLTNVDLAPYFEYQNLLGLTPNQYAQPLPEGVYNIYVEVYDFATGRKLSNKTGANTIIFQNDPPFLNLPLNNASIMQQNIQNIVFGWTPRSINVSNVEYEFSLVEIWDKYTPVQNAFAYSPPLYTTTTRNTTLQYGINEPQLIPGKKYAWRIKAKALLGAEEIGVFKNNGYSEIFSFTYEVFCTAPLAINTEGISENQAKVTWTGSIDNFDYQVKYREKNSGSEWYDLVTPRENATISNLKPNTTYEYTVGASCDVGKYTHSTVKEFTTLVRDEIAFQGCGIKPDPNDLTNKNPLPELFPNDVIAAGDFPIVVMHATGSNGTFSGDGYVTLPFLEKFRKLIDAADALGGDKVNIGQFSRIRITFDNIGLNTDFKLISGEIIAGYDASNWDKFLDVDKLVEDIQNFLNNYKGTDEDVTKAKELHKIQEEQISQLLADENLSQEEKAKIIGAQTNAKDSWNALENATPCLKNTNKNSKNEKGGPKEYYIEEEDNFDCYKAPIEKESKAIEEASGKTTCTLPQPTRGCAATGGIENPMNDGDWETVIKILKELKNAVKSKKPYTFTKIMTNLEAQISIGKICYDPILVDYSFMTDKTNTVKEVSFTNEITKSNFGGDYWTLIFNKLLWIKIKQEIKDGKDISKEKIDILEKWLNCDNQPKKEDEPDKPATINLTADLLSEVFTDTDKERLEQVAKVINKYSDKFDITTPLRMSYFLGQIGTETSFPAGNKPALTAMKESCNYSEKTIKNGFGKEQIKTSNGFKLKQPGLFEGYTDNSIISAPVADETYKTMKIKSKYIRSCELFDYVYCCGKKGLGNGDEASKDGSKFNGKGFIHLTGRSNYTDLSTYWNNEYPNNKKDFTTDEDMTLIETDIETGIIASMVFWNKRKINDYADDDNITKATQLVNGGLNGLSSRENFKNKAYEVLTK